MTDLRKAAEMALETLCVGANDAVPNDIDERFEQAIQALRQALDDKPPVKSYCGGVPNYCAPVDAVNMTQDRVDETAKGKHEPIDWEAVAADQAMTIAMMNIENKREWVDLTQDEMIECHREADFRKTYENISAKLKEKNGG